jgi:pyruvate kinase
MTVPSPRATKIIATLGPAASAPAQVLALAAAGADVFRLNFSHGGHAEQQQRVQAVRAAEAQLGRPLAVLADLQGPKLRIGSLLGGALQLEAGARLRLDLDPAPGTAERVPLPHPEVFAALLPGHELLLDDGKLRLRVLEAGKRHALTEVQVGGRLTDRKGVNTPATLLPLAALTAKDRNDLALALALEVDWIALSFVQRPADVTELRAQVRGRAGIIAKLEKPQALEALEEIVAVADALMVARGDLGVELPPEDVPVVQRRIVRACRASAKPVIVATQMLESMIVAPTPTRAETSDVAGAVYDGVDAVMLSAETAAGAYPVEAVRMMDRVIRRSEADPAARPRPVALVPLVPLAPIAPIAPALSGGAALGVALRALAEVLPLAGTITYTASGASALRVAHERPASPILAVTPHLATARRLALVWGVQPQVERDATDVEDMVQLALAAAGRAGLTAARQPLAIVAGLPFSTPGSTNLLRLVTGAEIASAAQPEAAPRVAPPVT